MNKIALVEDNPDNRLLVQAILEDLYEIIDYDNGRDAIDGILDNAPDLVLLDISLPEMDGAEVLQKLREHDRLRHLPVIALTAHAMSGDRERYLQLGFNDYLTKPIVDEEILIRTIRKWLTPAGALEGGNR